MLMHGKTILDCFYCIDSTKYSLKSAKTMALYFVTLWQSLPQCTFIIICLPGLRASGDSRWLPSSDVTLMFQKSIQFKTRWLLYSVLVQMICIFIYKKEIGLPLYAIISKQNKPNLFLFHPAVLDCQKLTTCFLYPSYFTLSFIYS